MSWKDAYGRHRFEPRRVDGGMRFWMGCKTCLRLRCCVSREDCELHCGRWNGVRPGTNVRR
jgi:hypothetical protein